MIEALALMLEQPRLDAVADRLRDANPELCRAGACPRPVVARTTRCGFAKGWTVKIDPVCGSKLSDDELAFVVGHEWSHTIGIRSEQAADYVGWAMMLRAGFSAQKASRVFATLGAKERRP